MNIKENSIVIVDDSYKERFLENFRQKNDLFDVTVLGLKEFKKKFYFDYGEETIYYVHNKYGVIKDVAQIYLENIYYVNDTSTLPKIKFLTDLKKDLENASLLIYDKNFKRFMKGKTVYLYNLQLEDKFYKNMFDELRAIAEVIELNDKPSTRTKKILYKLSDMDKEVAFVASKIAELLKSRLAIDHIKLANVQSDYVQTIKKTFKEFKIPLELPNDATISGSLIVGQFKDFFESDIKNTIEKLKLYVKTEEDEYVYKKILGVVNKYYWAKDYDNVKDFIFEDISKIRAKDVLHKHAVRSIDFAHEPIADEDYVFLLNFNQGSIPVGKKDEDYLSDEEKRTLHLSDSIDINKMRLTLVREKIATTKNLVITYSTRNIRGDLYISNAYLEELMDIEEGRIEFIHSDAYNKRVLLSERDERRKYGSSSKTLAVLENHYKDEPYCSFDNTFKGIDKNSLAEYLNHSLVLSYSSTDHYFKCSFRYYLDYILKVDAFEDTFASFIGTVFHEVLSKCFDENFDFESSWNTALKHNERKFNHMEEFYLGLLKEELKTIVDNLKEQTAHTELKNALYEKRITVPLDDEGKIIFKGFVDKILYDEGGEQRVVAIVDYKTGNPVLNLDDIVYGLDLQLPVYAYLIRHSEEFHDASIGGFYLQKILNNKKTPDEKKEALKLQGFSNANPRILRRVDSTYENSSLIKSMRTSGGEFANYAKVLRDDQIEKMISLVEEKIKEAARKIMDADFKIDPKEIAGKNRGCEFCKYKDICYVQNENVVKLDKKKKEDFLGGEENGMD